MLIQKKFLSLRTVFIVDGISVNITMFPRLRGKNRIHKG